MPIELQYAPRPPGMSPRIRRWLIAAMVALASAALLYWGIPLAYRQIEHLYWVHQVRRAQQRCMDFTAPANVVAYTDDLAERNSLFASSKLYRNGPLVAGGGATAIFGFQYFPEPWSQLQQACVQAYGDPRANGFGMGGLADAGCIFLHSRTGSAGNQRLVRVFVGGTRWSMYGGARGSYSTPYLVAHVFSLTADGPPQWQWTETTTRILRQGIDLAGPSMMRYFAGQVDPADPSHFTIDFTCDPRDDSEGGPPASTQPSPPAMIVHGTIDGYLRADDTVDLLPRQGWTKVLPGVLPTHPVERYWWIYGVAASHVTFASPTGQLTSADANDAKNDHFDSVVFSRDGKILATGGSRLCLWNMETEREFLPRGQNDPKLRPLNIGLQPEAFLADGESLVCGTAILDWPTGRPSSKWKKSDIAGWGFAVTSDGQFIFVCNPVSSPGRLWGYQASSGRRVFDVPLPVLDKDTNFLGATSSSCFFWSRSSKPPLYSTVIRAVDPSTGLERPGQALTWANPTYVEGPKAVSPDGKLLLCQSAGVSLVDATTGRRLVRRLDFESLGEWSGPPQFSPDGTLFGIAVGVKRPSGPPDPSGIVLWDVPHAQRRIELKTGGTAAIAAFAISPDSQHVAAVCGDGVVRLWDLPASPATQPAH